ncbi:hypothetical protein PULV_a0354 [Pseudoalteromonas ulvae UL12]|nr:hypothetical protein [Pseudoalteromonas ulvae UL12]
MRGQHASQGYGWQTCWIETPWSLPTLIECKNYIARVDEQQIVILNLLINNTYIKRRLN